MLRSMAGIVGGGLAAIVVGVIMSAVAGTIVLAAHNARTPRAPRVAAPAAVPGDPTHASEVVMLPRESMTTMTLTPPWLDTIVAVLAGLLGGYVGALIAGRDELMHGALTAWPLPIFSVFAVVALHERGVFKASTLIYFAGAIFLGASGGWLRKLQTSSDGA
jgi:putative membrane protein (TIGR04086 family)